jgi:hypothetical protein
MSNDCVNQTLEQRIRALDNFLSELNCENNKFKNVPPEKNPARHYDFIKINYDPREGLFRLDARKGYMDAYCDADEGITYLLRPEEFLPIFERLLKDSESEVKVNVYRHDTNDSSETSYGHDFNYDHTVALGTSFGRIKREGLILDLSGLSFTPDSKYQSTTKWLPNEEFEIAEKQFKELLKQGYVFQ